MEKAPAKINLSLAVLGKRPDGYHDLETVFVSLDLSDTLYFSDAPRGEITLACTASEIPLGMENLVCRAADLLRKKYGITKGVHIRLEKHIPAAAGLGGGSSDAAAALRGLVRFWGIDAAARDMPAVAARLGSDVPFCLRGGTALGEGRGERLTPLSPCPDFHVVLANPGFGVSTAKVYQAYPQGTARPRTRTTELIRALRLGDRRQLVLYLENNLEAVTFQLYPQVGQLKEKMSAWGPSLMCGSGATVFTLFEDREKARALCLSLREEGIAAWLTKTAGEAKEGDADA